LIGLFATWAVTIIVHQQHCRGGHVLEGDVASTQETDIEPGTQQLCPAHVSVEAADLISRPGVDQHEFDVTRIIAAQRGKRLQGERKAVVRDHDDTERGWAGATKVDWTAAEQRQQGRCLTAEQGLGLGFAYVLLRRRYRSQSLGTADGEIMRECVRRNAVAQRRLYGVVAGVVADVNRCAGRAPLSRAEGEEVAIAVAHFGAADGGGDVGIASQIVGFGELGQRVEIAGCLVGQVMVQCAIPDATRDGLIHIRIFRQVPFGIEIERGARLVRSCRDPA
jgi:hypothetical protein